VLGCAASMNVCKNSLLQILAASVALSNASCAMVAPRQAPPPPRTTTQVELTIKDMDPDLLDELQTAFAKTSEFKSAQLKSQNGRTAIFEIEFPGDPGDLPGAIARIPHPGLRFASAMYKAEYSIYDNTPPTVTIIYPQNEQLLNVKQLFVTVDVPDKDVAEVTVSGKPALRYKGSIYRAKLDLNDGKQEIVASAKDKAGNETKASVVVTIDTTAPAVNAEIKLLVEGTVNKESAVLIDGMEVPVDSDGRYRAEIPVRKGRKSVEIIAIDKAGNKTVTHKPIGD
jgi:hypothetical protein